MVLFFHLHTFQGHSAKETAELAGVSVSRVYVAKMRAGRGEAVVSADADAVRGRAGGSELLPGATQPDRGFLS